jgi:hypothetical protein
MTKYEIQKAAFIAASNIFLTESVPTNWEDMEEEEQNNFIKENAWQPFENYLAADIWTLISDASGAFILFYETLSKDQEENNDNT